MLRDKGQCPCGKIPIMWVAFSGKMPRYNIVIAATFPSTVERERMLSSGKCCFLCFDIKNDNPRNKMTVDIPNMWLLFPEKCIDIISSSRPSPPRPLSGKDSSPLESDHVGLRILTHVTQGFAGTRQPFRQYDPNNDNRFDVASITKHRLLGK